MPISSVPEAVTQIKIFLLRENETAYDATLSIMVVDAIQELATRLPGQWWADQSETQIVGPSPVGTAALLSQTYESIGHVLVSDAPVTQRFEIGPLPDLDANVWFLPTTEGAQPIYYRHTPSTNVLEVFPPVLTESWTLTIQGTGLGTLAILTSYPYAVCYTVAAEAALTVFHDEALAASLAAAAKQKVGTMQEQEVHKVLRNLRALRVAGVRMWPGRSRAGWGLRTAPW